MAVCGSVVEHFSEKLEGIGVQVLVLGFTIKQVTKLY